MTTLRISRADAAATSLLASRWLRPAAQWLGVGLMHAMVLALVMHVSPQARQMVSEIIQASVIMPRVQAQPKPPESPKPVPPRQKPQLRQPMPVLTAAAPVESGPDAFVVPPQPVVPPPAEPAPVIAAPAPPAPPLVPPIYNAAYLDNPPPAYPAMSRRRGETGRVLLRVHVSSAGRAERIEIKSSSGFDRLDEAAREAVLSWRFVPARRGEEPVSAWVQIPIVFVM